MLNRLLVGDYFGETHVIVGIHYKHSKVDMINSSGVASSYYPVDCLMSHRTILINQRRAICGDCQTEVEVYGDPDVPNEMLLLFILGSRVCDRDEGTYVAIPADELNPCENRKV